MTLAEISSALLITAKWIGQLGGLRKNVMEDGIKEVWKLFKQKGKEAPTPQEIKEVLDGFHMSKTHVPFHKNLKFGWDKEKK